MGLIGRRLGLVGHSSGYLTLTTIQLNSDGQRSTIRLLEDRLDMRLARLIISPNTPSAKGEDLRNNYP